jgi:ATP-dependent helicase/nuclease subunit B
MALTLLRIPSSSAFWQDAARAVLQSWAVHGHSQDRDMSGLRVVVPTFVHVQALKAALAGQIEGNFIPPRITTLGAWLDLYPPVGRPSGNSERLMSLYAELRQHAWLKKIFTARRNTDLMPLAQTLLKLSDELTQSMLPSLQLAPNASESRWQAALEHLPPNARQLLSDESQLVWSIWKSQLDGNDATAMRYAQMMQLAESAKEPLVWISPLEPSEIDQAFLVAYSERQSVLRVTLDWSKAALHAAYGEAWPEVVELEAEAPTLAEVSVSPVNIALCPAKSLEQEAQHGAQTIIDWLQQGKTNIAIIAQDRVVARRLRALLERAQVFVADETGWKLSTTRAAAALAAWFDVIASRAETIALLDLLKSPYLFAQHAGKTACVMAIELALRRENVSGGWEAIQAALQDKPEQAALMAQLARQANRFVSRKTMTEWIDLTQSAFATLEMHAALQADAAGMQVLQMLEGLNQECELLAQPFSFAEWRAFINMQMESTAFVAPEHDHRVVMLPLNGARLRSFDAVLVVGADADHLPSQPSEVLFFANAVRRELGLATREKQQREQLRDFVEVCSANETVVLSWQQHKQGEANPVSPWIERVELALARMGWSTLAVHSVKIAKQRVHPLPMNSPAPCASQLLPKKLSPSGYNSLVACPYQFFATRMLRLSMLDELSDMPEKRDYGDWLHQILKSYHEMVRDQRTALVQRADLLRQISDEILGKALKKNAAALGYYARWQKVMPAYLKWANEREEQGWQFEFGEQWLEKSLVWPDGAVTLHGRVDRIDANETGERMVLDYKTQNAITLNAKIKSHEDHQLAFYGLLSEQPVDAAHYVALEVTNKKISDVAAKDYAQWQQLLHAQIAGNMQAIAQGAPMSANGIESICQYCDVRGLCRKGAW